MKIGQLSRATGTHVETIRYYERIGLLPKPARTGGNYRDYGPEDGDRLNFIRDARGLGFDVTEVRSLLGLADRPGADHGDAGRRAVAHLEAVERKIGQLERLRHELSAIVDRRDGASDCRILTALREHDAPAGS